MEYILTVCLKSFVTLLINTSWYECLMETDIHCFRKFFHVGLLFINCNLLLILFDSPCMKLTYNMVNAKINVTRFILQKWKDWFLLDQSSVYSLTLTNVEGKHRWAALYVVKASAVFHVNFLLATRISALSYVNVPRVQLLYIYTYILSLHE